MADSRPPYGSLWKANLAAFALLILLSAGATMWQIHHMDKMFIKDASAHARLAANIIKINAKSSLLAEEALEEIIAVFLRNSLSFIEFLNSVEPFTQQELDAFAQKAGLAGITIVAGDERIESSPDWLPADPGQICSCPTSSDDRLIAFPKEGLYMVARKLPDRNLCLVAGIRNQRIATLYRSIDIRHSLREIANLQGIKYVRIEQTSGQPPEPEMDNRRTGSDTSADSSASRKGASHIQGDGEGLSARLKTSEEGYVVEVVMPLSERSLLVMGIDAHPLRSKHRLRWTIFAVTTLILMAIGAVVSLLLYRHQKNHLERMKEIEAAMHRQREEANLGRYAATIAHEIRNPLNAVSMGIQRIIMRKEGIAEADRRLLSILMEELNRVARIISDLLNYARPVEPELKPTRLAPLVERAVIMASQRYCDRRIEVDSSGLQDDVLVMVDPDLFYQVLSNLILNAFEAYEQEGTVRIAARKDGDSMVLEVSNSGRVPPADQVGQIFEPYFTKKVKGTGLGLAVSRRIVRAHGGTISARLQDGWLTIRVTLPLAVDAEGESEKTVREERHEDPHSG